MSKDVVIYVVNWKHEVLRARCKHCTYYRPSGIIGNCWIRTDKDGCQHFNQVSAIQFACTRFSPRLSFSLYNFQEQLLLF